MVSSAAMEFSQRVCCIHLLSRSTLFSRSCTRLPSLLMWWCSARTVSRPSLDSQNFFRMSEAMKNTAALFLNTSYRIRMQAKNTAYDIGKHIILTNYRIQSHLHSQSSIFKIGAYRTSHPLETESFTVRHSFNWAFGIYNNGNHANVTYCV